MIYEYAGSDHADYLWNNLGVGLDSKIWKKEVIDMRNKINFVQIGTALINEMHIVRNKFGVYFNDVTGEVIKIEDIRKRIYELTGESLHHSEVYAYIDVVCGKTDRKSNFYRKSAMKYGLMHGWK